MAIPRTGLYQTNRQTRQQQQPRHEKYGAWWLGLVMGITTVAIASIHHEPDTTSATNVTAATSLTEPTDLSDKLAAVDHQIRSLDSGLLPADDTPRLKTAKVRRGDNLVAILHRNRVKQNDINGILNAKPKALYKLYPGQAIRMQFTADDQLLALETDLSLTDTLQLQRDGEQFLLQHKTVELETRIAYASGTIKHSLFLSGQKAGLSDKLIMELGEIFGWDIDFALDLRDGDTFTIAYEEKFRQGEKVANGIIVAAEFVNSNNRYRSIAHRDNNNRLHYYTPEGDSMRRTFLKTPVKFSRISSRFTRKRFHPVLKRWRAHKGVDYSARSGTSIRTTAKGRVVFKGWKGGYGNTVIVKHGGSYSTLYAHMSRFARGMYVGKTVDQGQRIGYVGKTGMVTGAHLHYEFRVRGRHRNPLTFKFPKAQSIPAEYRTAFMQSAETWTKQLDIASAHVRVASTSELQAQ